MLNLSNDFYVQADSSGYTLCQIRRQDRSAIQKSIEDKGALTLSKKGDITIGYFGSLSAALDGYAKARIRQHVRETDTDLIQVSKLLKDIHDEISKVNA